MKKILLATALIAGVVAISFVLGTPVRGQDQEKVYVALEGDGKVAVLDAAARNVVRTIDLTEEIGDTRIPFMPHNVQVASDNKTVWVVANVMRGDDHAGSGSAPAMAMDYPDVLDEVIAIDPMTDQVVRRIPIALDSHLAHIVTSPDSKTLYATLQGKGELFVINAETGAIARKIAFGKDSGPHGLRISPDGTKAFVAMVSGKALAVVDTASGTVVSYPMGSGVVQTAVTPDGKYAFGSLYSTKAVARFDVATQNIDTIVLPADARGPVQLYPTPDSRYLYVADQGYYFDQPTSTVVYRIDIAKGAVDQTIPAGSAPHGIVVDGKGKYVYVTNLLSDDLSVIAVESGKEVARIPVGKMPNGVSVWSGRGVAQKASSAVRTEAVLAGVGTLSVPEKSYDFGTISMAKGKVSHAFKIKNTGSSPVTIKKVFTSCMCTTATLKTALGTKGPFGMKGHAAVPEINTVIASGEEAEVEVVFDPAAHGPAGTGEIRRAVYVETEGSNKPLELSFEAVVVK